MIVKNYIKQSLLFCLISFLLFFFCFMELSAEEVAWIEVAKTNNVIQYIDSNSIKYNNRGLLSVITKYSEINPDDKQIIITNTYLMAVDCENRLYSKLPLNGELKQVKSMETPINDKLIKKTILKSCAY